MRSGLRSSLASISLSLTCSALLIAPQAGAQQQRPTPQSTPPTGFFPVPQPPQAPAAQPAAPAPAAGTQTPATPNPATAAPNPQASPPAATPAAQSAAGAPT